MHEKVLPKGAKVLLKRLADIRSPMLDGWILAGGTGLALQLGHRRSEDFDFFRSDKVKITNLHEILKSAGSYETLQEDEKTLTVLVSGIKLSFFCIADPFIFKPIPFSFFGIADIRDIALMKIVAISGRGSRKDFVDLYSILRRGQSLDELFKLIPKKYGKGRDNIYHIFKSLTFFEDAEGEPVPRMFEPFNWKECRNFFIRHAHSVVLPD